MRANQIWFRASKRKAKTHWDQGIISTSHYTAYCGRTRAIWHSIMSNDPPTPADECKQCRKKLEEEGK